MDGELVYKGAFVDDKREGYGVEYNPKSQNQSKCIYEGI